MKLAANGLQLEVDVQGPASGQPLLLIMGLGMQLTGWPEPLVADLVARGFRVIRLDNRDAGLSQGFDHLGVPSLWRAALRHHVRAPVQSPYRLADMADDAAAVLDALGVRSAHVWGASMGGMIAQHLAVRRPALVRSLLLMMTTSGARHLPQPAPLVQLAMLARPRSQREEDVVDHLARLLQRIGSPAWPTEPVLLRQRLQATVRRAWRPQGTARQLLAVVADGDRTPLLRHIHAPTLVLHGQADPLVPPAAGQHLQQHIAGAQLELVPGMGHDLPPALLPRFAQALATLAARA